MIGFRTNAGSALVDYVIPTAVIGLIAGIALYTLNDDNLLRNFIVASTGNNVVTNDGTLAVGGSTGTTGATEADWDTDEVVEAGMTETESPELEGSEEISCAGGVCTVKVGGYTLTSVPEDIADYVASTGPAGGGDFIASVYEQIITQMEAEADPSEGALIVAIKALAEKIGLEKYNPVLPFQKASNDYLLETLIDGTYASDPRINVSGNMVNEERTLSSVSLTDPNLLNMLKSLSAGNTLEESLYSPLVMAANETSAANGKDYTELLNTLNYLQQQSTAIDSLFMDEVSSLAPGTDLASLQKVNLQTVKDNVASKMEDVTAASILAAAKGEI